MEKNVKYLVHHPVSGPKNQSRKLKRFYQGLISKCIQKTRLERNVEGLGFKQRDTEGI